MKANSRTFASVWMLGLILLCACPSQVNSPKIEGFTATPSSLPNGGGNVTLAWNVTGASNLSIEPNIGSVSGASLVVNVNSNRTFTLKASTADVAVTASASVTVVGGVDTTAPTLLSQSPLPGATGVTKDTSLVLTFSETMNKTQTQTAYTSSSIGIRPNEVGFSWNADATVLTIKSNAPLNYANGTDPSTTTALEYAFTMASGASDLAGNPLAPVAANFKTLRQLIARVPGDPIQDGSVDGTTVSNNSTDMTITTSSRGFLGFNIGGLPTTLQATSISAATLRVNAQFPMVFSSEQIELEHVAYGATLTASATTSTALRNLGNLTEEPPKENAWKTANVLPAIQDDWTNRTSRGNRSQYRLRCTGCTVIFFTAEAATSSGDAQFKVPELVLEYLLP
jgi:Bacterial Ig-like domain